MRTFITLFGGIVLIALICTVITALSQRHYGFAAFLMVAGGLAVWLTALCGPRTKKYKNRNWEYIARIKE